MPEWASRQDLNHQQTLDLPSVRVLAAQIASEPDNGTGVAWVRGVPPLDEQTLRLLYLALSRNWRYNTLTANELYEKQLFALAS